MVSAEWPRLLLKYITLRKSILNFVLCTCYFSMLFALYCITGRPISPEMLNPGDFFTYMWLAAVCLL